MPEAQETQFSIPSIAMLPEVELAYDVKLPGRSLTVP